MISYERAVRFEEVDAAGILFFARYLEMAHQAMDRFFSEMPSSTPGLLAYAELITRRKIGMPTVHVEMDCRAPLRYGDVARVDVSVTSIGHSSCGLRYVVTRGDGVKAAEIRQVVVSTDLATVTKVPLPADVRALLTAHLEADAQADAQPPAQPGAKPPAP